jgi:hypothetical protein
MKSNPELEPDVPDWSSETASDDLLKEQLREQETPVEDKNE